jgi:uncharacterized protein (DUF433 family)
MKTHEPALFTPTEAAVLTRMPVKAVNNAIDKQTVSTIAGDRAGHATRLLDLNGLISLALEQRLADWATPEMRRKIFGLLEQTPRQTLSLNDGLLIIDLSKPRRELAASIWQLRRICQMVTSDPDNMGGDPVFRGTRVQVHLIATLLANGSTEAELIEDYPRITAEMIRLAPIYAAAYPLRGRPRAEQPWRKNPPILRIRRKLATNEAV